MSQRLHFTNFNAGAESVIVYAYDRDQVVVRGPYTARLIAQHLNRQLAVDGQRLPVFDFHPAAIDRPTGVT